MPRCRSKDIREVPDVKAAVILFPGSNRDGDVARALRLSGADVQTVWHADDKLPAGTDLAVLPGGFSYGDYLRCGAIAARSAAMDAVRAHAARGGLVLGICNGFQILCESGLLPGALMRNAKLRFICHRQHVRVERTDTDFTRQYRAGQVIDICVAHGEGNYTADPATLARLEGYGLVAFRYCDSNGEVSVDSNVNGSTNSIAGIYSQNRKVLGLMPHPENFVDPIVGGTDGKALFDSLVGRLAAAA